MRTKGGGGLKIPKIVRTSFMYGPLLLTETNFLLFKDYLLANADIICASSLPCCVSVVNAQGPGASPLEDGCDYKNAPCFLTIPRQKSCPTPGPHCKHVAVGWLSTFSFNPRPVTICTMVLHENGGRRNYSCEYHALPSVPISKPHYRDGL